MANQGPTLIAGPGEVKCSIVCNTPLSSFPFSIILTIYVRVHGELPARSRVEFVHKPLCKGLQVGCPINTTLFIPQA